MAGRVSDLMRAIRRRYGIDETLVSALAREGIEINFVDDAGLNVYGAIVVSHQATGVIAAIEPIYVRDGNFIKAIAEAVGHVRAKAHERTQKPRLSWPVIPTSTGAAPAGFAAANFGQRV